LKTLPAVLLAISCGLVSCEKAKEIAGRLAKKPAAEVTTPAGTGSWVTAIPEGGYDSFRLQTGKVVVIDFYADWCGPCRQLSPILDKIVSEHSGKIIVGKINVDQNRELASKEGVRGIPDVRIFRDGSEVDRFVGLPDEGEVRRRLEIHTKGLPAHSPAAGEAIPGTPQPSTQPMSKDWLPPGMQRR
jgi:thioredoxin 1